jgi:hypothetical protein
LKDYDDDDDDDDDDDLFSSPVVINYDSRTTIKERRNVHLFSIRIHGPSTTYFIHSAKVPLKQNDEPFSNERWCKLEVRGDVVPTFLQICFICIEK